MTETGIKNQKKLRGKEVQPNKVVRAQHTEVMQNGREYPDPTPIAPPVGFIKQPTLAETMRQMVRSEELKRAARESGAETFEEADDFDVGDDYDPKSPYEEEFEPAINSPDPNEARTEFIDTLAQGIKKAFTEEKPTPATPVAPEAAEPPQAAPAAPTDPITSFFKK